MISNTSRYKETGTYIVNNTKILQRREMETYKDFYKYIVIEGDTLYNIAYKCYGSETYWWRILEANPRYNTPLDIKPGDMIYIPIIKGGV